MEISEGHKEISVSCLPKKEISLSELSHDWPFKGLVGRVRQSSGPGDLWTQIEEANEARCIGLKDSKKEYDKEFPDPNSSELDEDTLKTAAEMFYFTILCPQSHADKEFLKFSKSLLEKNFSLKSILVALARLLSFSPKIEADNTGMVQSSYKIFSNDQDNIFNPTLHPPKTS